MANRLKDLLLSIFLGFLPSFSFLRAKFDSVKKVIISIITLNPSYYTGAPSFKDTVVNTLIFSSLLTVVIFLLIFFIKRRGNIALKNYLKLFLLSTLLVFPIASFEAAILWFVGFGGGPVIIYPILAAINIFLVAFVAYLFSRKFKLSFIISLIVVVLPAVIMISWEQISYKNMSDKEKARMEVVEQFRKQSQAEIGSVITLSNPIYRILKFQEDRSDLIMIVDANIPIEFDRAVLHSGVKFYFNDVDYSDFPSNGEFANQLNLKPGCGADFKQTELKSESAQGGRYQPGNYKIQNGLRFFNCSTDDILKIAGMPVFIRGQDGELIQMFNIENIEVVEYQEEYYFQGGFPLED